MPIFLFILVFTASLLTPLSPEEGNLPRETQTVGEDQVVTLPFTPDELKVDEEAEQEMLKLLNAEREALGLVPLELDEELQTVARNHSSDMWNRRYFAHQSPEGKTALERIEETDLFFDKVGENLALTKTTLRAHNGLMNSPGHRRNILDQDFRRVGIGVIDGGIYGKMFTQNFSD